MALTQQSDGTSYQKPIGNKNKAVASPKQNTIPLPQQRYQDGAQGILDMTPQQRAATAVPGYSWDGLSPIGYFEQILNMKQSQDAANKAYSFADTGTGGKPTQNIYAPPVTESQINQGIGGYDAGKQGIGNTIPLPEMRQDPRTSLATPMGAGMNLSPEDYANTAFPQWLQGFMDKYGFRQEIDSRFPAGVDEESAFNYLYEKYGFMFPEMTDWLPDDGGGGGGDYSYNGGGSSYIPMPDYSTWGGGGYGNDNGYRDSGLVNWRI